MAPFFVMSQVIRKYQNSGTIDRAPIEIMGYKYDPDVLKANIIRNADSYAKAMGWDGAQINRFKQMVADRANQIASGNVRITDAGTLENNLGFSNTGVRAKKKFLGRDLTEEELNNNTSMDVVNYINQALSENAFQQYNAPKNVYRINTKNIIEKGFAPNGKFDFNAFNDLDKADSEGNRLIKNRLAMIADLFDREADRLENDIEYRRSFSYDNNNDWEHRYVPAVQELRDISQRIRDGNISDEDIQAMASHGIDLSQYLTTKVKQATSATEQNTQQQAANTPSDRKWIIPKPWESADSVLRYDGVDYTYGTPEFDKLHEDNPDARKMIDDAVESANQLRVDDNEGYYNYSYYPYNRGNLNYGLDIAPLFPNLASGTELIVFSDNPYSNKNNIVFLNGNPVEIKVSNGGTYYAQDANDNITMLGMYDKYAQPTKLREYRTYDASPLPDLEDLVDKQLTEEQQTNIKNALNDIYSSSDNINKHFKLIQQLYNIERKKPTSNIKDIVSVGTVNNKKTNVIQIKTSNGIVEYILSALPNQLSRSNIIGVKKYKNKPNKGQLGLKFKYIESEPVEAPKVQTKDEDTQTDTKPVRAASFSSEENKKTEEALSEELTGTDKVRLGAAAADLASALTSFIPYLNIASAGVGIGSSLGEFGADMTDLINGRKGSRGFLSSLGNLGLNIGMDLVSLVPGGKSVKSMKAMKTILKWAPWFASGYNLVRMGFNEEERNSIADSFKKLNDLDLSKLNSKDLHNISNVLRIALAGKGGFQYAKSNIKTYKNSNIEIQGKVKIGDKTETITAIVPRETLGTSKKSAQEALASAAKEKFKDAEIDPKSIEVNTNWIRRARGTTKPNDDYMDFSNPDGFIASRTRNWWLSDQNLLQHSNYLRRQYNMPQLRRNEVFEPGWVARGRAIIEKKRGIKKSDRSVSTQTTHEEPSSFSEISTVTPNSTSNSPIPTTPVITVTPTVSFRRPKVSSKNRSAQIRENKKVKSSEVLNNLERIIGEFHKLPISEQRKSPLWGSISPVYNANRKLVRYDVRAKKVANSSDPTRAYLYPESYTYWLKLGGSIPYLQSGGMVSNTKYTYDPNTGWYDIIYNTDWGKKAYDSITLDNLDAVNKLQNRFFTDKINTDWSKDKIGRREEVGKYQADFNNMFGAYLNKGAIEDAIKAGKITRLGKTGDNTAGNYVDYYAGAMTNLRHLGMNLDAARLAELNTSLNKRGIEAFINPDTKMVNFRPIPKTTTQAITQTNQADQTAGKSGFTANGTERGDSKGPKSRTEGGLEVNPEGSLSMTEALLGMLANSRATGELMKSTANTRQTPWINRYLFGNYPAMAIAGQNAGELNTQTSVPISSDASLAYNSRMAANYQGRQLLNNAALQNYNSYMTSRGQVQQGNETNEANAINATNENAASVNAMENLKYKWMADLITSNVAGNIKPWLSEQRKNIHENNVLRNRSELSYMQNLAQMQAQDELDNLLKKYVQEAKDNKAEGNTDEEILANYMKDHPDRGEAYDREQRDIKENTYRTNLNLVSDLSSTPLGIPLIWRPEYKTEYSIKAGRYVPANKEGGKMSTADKIRLQQEKDYNKARQSDSKESFKAILENQKEFGKMYRSMSAGTLKLIQRAIQ